ncbi:MAG: ADP-ribosylation factor-like protein [Candidatus Kariarchaeaceae archaeon]
MASQDPIFHKIIFAGLAAVGKTSIYKSVIENVDLKTIETLLPTRGIERKFHTIAGHKLVFWDLGGQESYRSGYFQDPRIFAETSLLIYVLDIQDKERFDDSVEYLLQILMTIKNLDAPPRVFVLIHKYDPAKMTELRFNLLEASNILKEANKFPSMKITKFATSIYNDNLDSVVEGILKELIPDYSNELLRKDHEVQELGYKPKPEVDIPAFVTEELVSGMEFELTKDSEKSDFQRELAKHIDMIKDLMGGEPKKEPDTDSDDN